MAIRQIHIQGYRSIRDLKLGLSQVNVVLGPNGCGKTNLYRALHLLHVAAEGELAQTLSREGGLPSVVWAGPRSRGPSRLQIGVELDEFGFELEIKPFGRGESDPFFLDPDIKSEVVSVLERGKQVALLERKGGSAFARDSKGERVTFPFELWGNESVLSQLVEPHRFPIPSMVRGQLLGWRFYHSFRTDPDAPARLPHVGVRTPVLSHTGFDLAAALKTIQHIGNHQALDEGVQRAFPGAVLDVRDDAGRFSVALQLPGVLRPLEGAELSDGTIRYLCQLAALLSPRPAPFLALNEPETSLHPDLLPALAALVVEAGKHSQVLVTTHSGLLASEIQALCDAEPVQLERVNGATTVQTG